MTSVASEKWSWFLFNGTDGFKSPQLPVRNGHGSYLTEPMDLNHLSSPWARFTVTILNGHGSPSTELMDLNHLSCP